MMNFRITATKTFILFLIALSHSFLCFAQKDSSELYLRYIDSAEYNIQTNPKASLRYLDSIPKPVEDYVEGHLAEYYDVKATLDNRLDNQSDIYQNLLLTLKYAELEEKYEIAGRANLELFYNVFIIKKDSSAFDYLKKSNHYFELIDDKHGLADVKQMYAYAEFYNKNYEASNQLIINDLDYYKAIDDDAFYQLYALFLLSSNYMYLDDLGNAHKYFNEIKTLKNDTTLTDWLYNIHTVTLNCNLAEIHLKNNAQDSTFFYLDRAAEARNVMDNSDVETYFKTYIEAYTSKGDTEKANAYIDSLNRFQKGLLKETIVANYNSNKVLVNTEEKLETESKKKQINKTLWILLLLLLLSAVTFFAIRHKKLKSAINDFMDKLNEYSYLKKNHEKLKVKVQGFEKFIEESKKEIKRISNINDAKEQKEQIKTLYRNIHLHSSTLVGNGTDHLNLINELNVDFFNELSKRHPQLNESEIIICYYLFTGFKNKEIAAFLNTSLRSIESKRYRIGKKLKIKDKGLSLVEYLLDTFKHFS
ncbi:LuxR C-terminal-related transcriptional regulator [Winogradskyella sp.]|uniref:helix-turn-helix transcriptional regulator n=1 Tax=Winogradskyella sp. TaxID=1883156 RepID=UPI001AFEC331|nr:LuxR C-terminal-related transcriptional regulator [Winogradskyella sp.]MBO6880461.1 hypothetical protein [Winogradskyella sp.]